MQQLTIISNIQGKQHVLKSWFAKIVTHCEEDKHKCLESQGVLTFKLKWRLPEASTRGVLWKKVFLEILQIHRKTSVPESFYNKVTALRPAILLKERLRHRCFPVNFAKFLRTPFWRKASGRLLLDCYISTSIHSFCWLCSKFDLIWIELDLFYNISKLNEE